ncbi:MAG: alkaline phosphatase family protein [Planctomycetota bacterium]|nr:MAG: alkaline phosphatase family protein [Planctomycetota bacterium]
MDRSKLLLTLLIGFLGACASAQSPSQPTTVLLISLDGVRHDDLGSGNTPTLDRLSAEGAHAERLLPVFPTLTFPNHYSLATGLHPGQHGIVGNTIYDPGFDATFKMGNSEVVDGRWWGGEPIWITAVRQGQRSATLFWPGSEAEIHGRRPTYWLKYDGRLSHADRVKQVLAWLDMPAEERPQFLTLYFSANDSAAHEHGPGSEEQQAALRDIDTALGALVKGLEARESLDEIDLIVVSDHGMTEVSPERAVFLDDFVDVNNEAELVIWGATSGIWPKAGRGEALLSALKAAPLEHARVFAKEETPESWHFRDHVRVPPIVLVADEGWSITTRSFHTPERTAHFKKGTHGFDPSLPSMHGIFLAHGPHFRAGASVPSLSAVDVYPLMAELLGLEPAENAGSLRASEALRSEGH